MDRNTFSVVCKTWCAILALAMIAYHFFYILRLPYEPSINAIVHLGLACSVLALANLGQKFGLADLLCLLVAIAVTWYFFTAYDVILEDPSYPPQSALIAGIASCAVSFYLTWRIFGFIFPLIAVLGIAYMWFGSLLPGSLHAPNMDFERLVTLLAADVTSPWGLYGSLLILSANYLFLFIIFGSILEAFGGLRFVMSVGNWAARWLKSGAASLSIFSSALLGSITGSTVANITVTGVFTIPLMKKSRYTAEQAAAIETAASCGGQILPPVMGATVFVMSGFTGIPYVDIVKASVFPALIYFGQLFIYAELNARKRNILPMQSESVDRKTLLLSAAVFVLPLALLLFLLFSGLSLMKTIFFCILAAVAIGFVCNLFQKEKLIWRNVLQTIVRGAISGSQIAVVLALIGTAVAAVEVTGIGIKLGSFLVALSQNSLPILLFFTAFTAVLLGIGLPSPAAYIICATILSPALIKLGVPLLQAHLFPLYYALFSHLTPPVGIGLMVACKMANSNYTKSALEAMKAALPSFILPFLFVYAPGVLLLGGGTLANVTQTVGCFLFFTALGILSSRYFALPCKPLELIMLLVALILVAVFLLHSAHALYLLPASALFLIMGCWRNWRRSRNPNVL